MKVYLKLILGVFQTLILLVLISLSTISFYPKLHFYTINSGSMEPTLKTGSLIYIASYKLDELKKGDIITFISGQNQKSIVTHRIADLQKITQKISLPGDQKQTKEKIIYEITTKGDANDQNDTALVSPSQILGVYHASVPYLGYLISYTKTPSGFFMLIVFPICLLIVAEVVEIILYFKNYYQNQAGEK